MLVSANRIARLPEPRGPHHNRFEVKAAEEPKMING